MAEGYVKAPHDFLRDPSLSPAAKVALLLIDGMPDGYHPTREQWMGMLPCSDKRTWWRVINELQQAGLITVERQGTKKIYKSQQKGAKPHRKRVQNHTGKGCKTTPIERCENAPHEKNIIEEQKNNIVVDARARLREEVTTDAMVEMGCMSIGISSDTYTRLTAEIFNDWEFTGIPDNEWNKGHFLSVMRIKAREQKRNEQNNNNRGTAAASREQRAANVAAKMAALAASSKCAKENPF